LLFVLLVFSFSIPAFIPELTGISVIFLRVTGFSSTGSAPSSAKGASLSPPLFHRIFQVDAEAIESEIPVINMVNIGKGTISNQNKKGPI
jgi:hypothetical protein